MSKASSPIDEIDEIALLTGVPGTSAETPEEKLAKEKAQADADAAAAAGDPGADPSAEDEAAKKAAEESAAAAAGSAPAQDGAQEEDQSIVGLIATRLGVELEDGLEDSEESLVLVATKAAEKLAEDRIKSEEERYPVMGRLREYLAAGGDPDKFLQETTKHADLSKLEKAGDDLGTQKRLVAESMRLRGMSESEINELVTDFEASGMLPKRAEAALAHIKEHQGKAAERLIQAQAAEQAARDAELEKYRATVKTTIQNKTDFKGVVLPATERAPFQDYLFKPVKDGKSQRDLDAEAADLDTQLAVDLLLFHKFDFKKLAGRIATQTQVDTLRSRLAKRQLPSGGASAATGRPGSIEDLDLP